LKWSLHDGHTLHRDIQYASRQIRRAPGVFLVVITTLALGIGANAALFTLISATISTPPAGVGNSRQLVRLSNVEVETSRASRLSRTDFAAYRDRTTVFSGAALMLDQTFTLTGDRNVEEVRGQAVSPSYFTVLEAPLAHHRQRCRRLSRRDCRARARRGRLVLAAGTARGPCRSAPGAGPRLAARGWRRIGAAGNDPGGTTASGHTSIVRPTTHARAAWTAIVPV